MGLIDQINELRTQGYPDDQIIDYLKQQGSSMKDINDALNQAQIKNAVMGEQNITQPEYSQQGYAQPMTQEQYPQDNQQYSSQEQYAQQGYPQDNYQQGYTPQQVDSETIMQVAEQVFEDKIKKTEKQITDFNEFKTISKTQIDSFSERLKRIETMMDQLQIKILEKISSYGENLDSIKNEMSMMEDSFQKMTNPILDNYNKSPSSGKTESKKSEEREDFSSSSVDDILRKSLARKK